MNQKTISDLSAELLIRYYNNDPLPFLDHMDDDALWYGPAAKQFIRGRKNMIKAWESEEHSLTFTLGDIKTATISSHPSFCEVMLLYPVVTHYPDGHSLSVNQRLHMSWGERTVTDYQGNKAKVPKILFCHISNPHAKHEDDTIYFKSYSQIYANRDAMPQKAKRLHFYAVDKTTHFLLSDSIYIIEAASTSKHSVIRSTSGNIEVRRSITEIADEYPQLFLRCHQSFLVNPNYIRSIHRFRVTMMDGTVLPIAEKRYTTFRDQATKLHAP